MAFLAFIFTAIILAITPSPGIAYVVARTVAGGRPEGFASCLGTGLGGLVHVLAAAFGLRSGSLVEVEHGASQAVEPHLGRHDGRTRRFPGYCTTRDLSVRRQTRN